MVNQEKDINKFNIDKGSCCPYCSNNNVLNWELDHIIPKSKNGLNIKCNLIYVCKSCNNKKYNFDLLDVFNELELSSEILGKYYLAKKICSELENEFEFKTQSTQKYSEDEMSSIEKEATKQHLKVATFIRKCVLDKIGGKK